MIDDCVDKVMNDVVKDRESNDSRTRSGEDWLEKVALEGPSSMCVLPPNYFVARQHSSSGKEHILSTGLLHDPWQRMSSMEAFWESPDA